MVILESDSELEIINKKSWDIEFVEEEKLKNSIILRIGLRQEHEVQLYYCLKSINRAKKLRRSHRKGEILSFIG